MYARLSPDSTPKKAVAEVQKSRPTELRPIKWRSFPACANTQPRPPGSIHYSRDPGVGNSNASRQQRRRDKTSQAFDGRFIPAVRESIGLAEEFDARPQQTALNGVLGDGIGKSGCGGGAVITPRQPGQRYGPTGKRGIKRVLGGVLGP